MDRYTEKRTGRELTVGFAVCLAALLGFGIFAIAAQQRIYEEAKPLSENGRALARFESALEASRTQTLVGLAAAMLAVFIPGARGNPRFAVAKQTPAPQDPRFPPPPQQGVVTQ